MSDEGRVLTWGHGRQGQLGHGTSQNCETPKVVEGLREEHIIYVACGSSSSAAITGMPFGTHHKFVYHWSTCGLFVELTRIIVVLVSEWLCIEEIF